MPATITIKPWNDPVVDTVGHDPRSLYVETFWLPTLGPTALLLLRHLAARFDEHPAGIELPVAEASQALGLGDRAGNSSPIVRSLGRLEQFDLACTDPHSPTVAVRRNLPPVNRRHVRRLPAHLQVGRAASRSRCSSRATTPTTSSASSIRPASTRRCATRPRAGRGGATGKPRTRRASSPDRASYCGRA